MEITLPHQLRRSGYKRAQFNAYKRSRVVLWMRARAPRWMDPSLPDYYWRSAMDDLVRWLVIALIVLALSSAGIDLLPHLLPSIGVP